MAVIVAGPKNGHEDQNPFPKPGYMFSIAGKWNLSHWYLVFNKEEWRQEIGRHIIYIKYVISKLQPGSIKR